MDYKKLINTDYADSVKYLKNSMVTVSGNKEDPLVKNMSIFNSITQTIFGKNISEIKLYKRRAGYKNIKPVVMLNENIKAKEVIRNEIFDGKVLITKSLKTKQIINVGMVNQATKLNSILQDVSTLTEAALRMFIAWNPAYRFDYIKGLIYYKKQTLKLGKAFRKFLKEYNFREKDIEHIINNISECYGKKIGEITFSWSTALGDFSRQSFGNNWQSCHRVRNYEERRSGKDKESITPQWSGGDHTVHPWLSLGLDMTTTMLYIESTAKTLQARMMIYINTDTKEWGFGRAYPNASTWNGNPQITEFIKKHMKARGYTHKKINRETPYGATSWAETFKKAARSNGVTEYFFDYNDHRNVFGNSSEIKPGVVGIPAKLTKKLFERITWN